MGSPGVGKTTELNRLITDIQDHYSCLYFSVLQSLDGRNFKATDMLLLMMILLVEKTQQPVDQGGAGSHPRSDLLTGIWKWFQVEKEIFKEQTLVGLDMSAGVDISPEVIWAKLLGLFARLKGEFKFSSNRNIEVEQYRLKRVDELLDLMNQLLEECNQRLKDATGKEWLFIGDDFEKPAISLIRNEDFFIGNGSFFSNSMLIFSFLSLLIWQLRQFCFLFLVIRSCWFQKHQFINRMTLPIRKGEMLWLLYCRHGWI